MSLNRSTIIAGLPAQADPGCALIEINTVTKLFKTEAGDFPALKNVSLCFGQGEYASIMGKSGSGKSTLVNMITGIDHPTTGSVTVAGVEVHRLGESQLAEWRGRNLGIVFQFFQLLPMLSVLENTILPMDFCKLYDPGEREGRAMRLLELVGLQAEADKLPAALSGGQQQMAAIARALANDPPLIVADEPTGNLDSRTAGRVLELFDGLVEQGKTVIIVTHDSALARRAGRHVLISDGEIIDEAVGRALPGLPHPILLKISQQAVIRPAAAGETLARPGEAGCGLFVVTQGRVEAWLEAAPGDPLDTGRRLDALGEFEAIGEEELAGCSDLRIAIRVAADGPANLLWLDHTALARLLGDSPAAAGALRHAAEARCVRWHAQVDERQF